MTLSEYMAHHELSDAQVAAAVGVHRATVSRYRRDKERPSWDVIDRIMDWTHGAVMPNDWSGRNGRKAAE